MALHQRLARASAAAPGPGRVDAVWRGTIVEVLAGGMAWVTVPGLMGAEPVGPLQVFGAPAPLGAGVLVLAVGGRRDDLVVLPPVL